jgi:hypothetical protein
MSFVDEIIESNGVYEEEEEKNDDNNTTIASSNNEQQHNESLLSTDTAGLDLLSIACATVADESMLSTRSVELVPSTNGGDDVSETRAATTVTFNPFRDDDDGWISRQTVCVCVCVC